VTDFKGTLILPLDAGSLARHFRLTDRGTAILGNLEYQGPPFTGQVMSCSTASYYQGFPLHRPRYRPVPSKGSGSRPVSPQV